VAKVGVILNCLPVMVASSRATISPRIVTMSALSFRLECMVMVGVLSGVRLEVISRPAIMLPHASRLIGLITAGLFSLMGERAGKRGWPIETKKMTRRL